MWKCTGPKMYARITNMGLTCYVECLSGKWCFCITETNRSKAWHIIQQGDDFANKKDAQTACDRLISNW